MRIRSLRVIALLAALGAVAALAACDSEPDEGTPSVMRIRFETEMKTILRDVKAAEETAAATEDRYLELGELKGRYLNRPIPASYRLSLSDVSDRGFTASIVHERTGLSCRLEVGPDGTGVPECP